MDVTVQEEGFDPGAQLNAFAAIAGGAGAVVSFTGRVRDVSAGLHFMEIEHYPAMTQSAIESICQEARARWRLEAVRVIHRYGRLEPGETIMMVLAAAKHRADAFSAADFMMDYLKSRAPFWKKEYTRDGAASWVAAKNGDVAALARWSGAQK